LKEWKSVKVELVNYKKNRELFWVELEITPVYAEGSTLCTHWIGVQRIITQRKAAEHALQLSNQRLNMAMEASGLGFWTRHPSRNESFRDERWHAMLGYAPRHAATKVDEWLKLIHPDDVAAIKASESEAVMQLDATFEREFRMRHNDGRWVWIQSRGKVIERDALGQPVVIAGTHLDITSKVEARQITERLNAQMSRCLEHVNVGVILQRDGIIKFVNSTLLNIFGATDQSPIVGTKFSNYILPGDLKDAAWRQSQLYAGASVPSFWFNCVHLDGHTFKALTSSVVIEWGGEPHILSTITPPGDIALFTLEAENNRSRYDTLLAKRVEVEQVRIAQELHDSVGSQLAGIALHAANIKLLADGSGDNLTLEADQLLAQIKKAAEMTRSLARGLAPVDAWPGAFWRALEKLCHDFSSTKQIKCLFEMQGNFDDIAADTGTHLYRIAQEAINNALRHGGASHISVNLSATQDRMTLSIQDDGVGFDAAAVVGAHGSGVGLSSMYARAKTIDGQITLERTGPKGFCVAVSWPNASQQ
ncbi:MAG: PAS domain-containing protein, partial [Vitreoscilla sp.]|nr:PAS domain-containing protein [Polaromonas sp.]